MAGASITTPFKLDVLPRVDEIDAMATRVGAVNTLVDARRPLDRREHRRRRIPRTARAAAWPLQGHARDRARRGRRGARRSAVALGAEGAHVTVCARRAERRDAVATLVGRRVGAWPPRAGAGTCSSTRRRSAAAAPGDDPMDGVPLDGETRATTSIYDPDPTRRSMQRHATPAASRSAASRCSWRRRSAVRDLDRAAAARRTVRAAAGAATATSSRQQTADES